MDSSNQLDSSIAVDVVDTITEQTNIFSDFWNSIDWYKIISGATAGIIQILFFMIFFYAVKRIGNFFIERTFENYRKKKEISTNRLNTLYNLTQNLFQSFVGFFLAYAILSAIGIPVGTLLAGAGVIGLALSLGAQGFVSDIVNGFFLLLEKQIDVGDVVDLDAVSGTVVDVNLKTTKVKSFDGTLNFIPNRYITIVSNKSREDMRAQIDIRLLPDTDIAKVNRIIENVNEKLVPQYPEITELPANLGLIDLGNGHYGIRIVIFTLHGHEFGVQNAFSQEYITALTKEGIEIPINPLNIKP
ncbi:MAG: mechanosensitive ion channel domain-containing protein [Carnobacterium inhibens]|uniref:Mechanosensitive ion channel n=1 Tax=Carnobacterium inhibens TaxID=147709 RepID=A0ABR7TDJ5_9LACT|nr:mechanosensitive ion channel domain-containing protein [Carnobacterium inhibens]MBC9825276.1 mechanosensitive ion channel [Carnobacterium inhibens]MCM3513039.1 mechanosensitive ion channel family protein [Carnobacterium inhibens]